MAEWISIKDRLPDDGETVIIYISVPENQGGHEVTSGRYLEKAGKNYWEPSEWREGGYNIVSHWMPLPDPPVEE